MRYNHILIDGNNFFFRTFISASKKDTGVETDTPDKIFVSAIENALNRLKDIVKTHGAGENKTTVWFLVDNPKSKINIRKYIDPNYKSPRDKKKIPEKLYLSLDIFAKILKCYSDNYVLAWSDSLEADDLTLPIINKIKPNKNEKVLCCSADLDWARNISEYVHWLKFQSGKKYEVYDLNKFKNEYGFTASGKSIQLYKAIAGDRADSIPIAVKNIPKKILSSLIENYKDVDDFFRHYKKDNLISETWKKKIKKSESRIRLNYQLADFVRVEKDLLDTFSYCRKNINELVFWYDTLCIPKEPFMIDTETENVNIFEAQKLRLK